MTKNIQDTVFEIVKFARQSGLPSIRKADIMEEAKKTPLAKDDIPNYSGIKSKLQCQVDQALVHLKKNKRIKKRGKGWTIDTKQKSYPPVICRHIQEKEDGRFWCPIKKVFIGDPARQCELLHGTDHTKLIKSVDPMCPGYTNRRSTAVSQEYSKKLIDIQNQKREESKRYHTPNVRDPLSKSYLPKLIEEEK